MNSIALIDSTQQNLKGILAKSIRYQDSSKAIVVYDEDSPMAHILTEAYRQALPDAEFILFASSQAQSIRERFASLRPEDLVVLVQSQSFRLQEFRIRVELFEKGIKVIEHPHLENIREENQHSIYVQSLEYDQSYYQDTGRFLEAAMTKAISCRVISQSGNTLVFDGGLEKPCLNIGDYTQMKNTGGQFPIGEVFTENRLLERVHGQVDIFAYGDMNFITQKPASAITLIVDKGVIVSTHNSTPGFDRVLDQIRKEENQVWLRELGFGLNRVFTAQNIIDDIGTYERMCGVHFSLGAKHSLYKKPEFTRKMCRFHVDVFADLGQVLLDEALVYDQGQWLIE